MADRRRHAWPRPRRHHGREPDAVAQGAQAARRSHRRDGQEARAGDRRRWLQLDGRGGRLHQACCKGRCRCGAGRHALLQQADAGRPLPPLQSDQRRGEHPDYHLQHSRPLGRGHERRDDDALLCPEERRRREGRDRQPRAGLPAARGDGAGVQHAVGRGRYLAGLHGARRPRLHLGHVQHRATAVRGVPERVPQGRLPRRAGAAGSPDAAARHAVLRVQTRAR